MKRLPVPQTPHGNHAHKDTFSKHQPHRPRFHGNSAKTMLPLGMFLWQENHNGITRLVKPLPSPKGLKTPRKHLHAPQSLHVTLNRGCLGVGAAEGHPGAAGSRDEEYPGARAAGAGAGAGWGTRLHAAIWESPGDAEQLHPKRACLDKVLVPRELGINTARNWLQLPLSHFPEQPPL